MRITAKILAGYREAHKEWISDNDSYNLAHFGITKAQYDAISNALYEEYGLCIPSQISLAAINRRLANSATS